MSARRAAKLALVLVTAAVPVVLGGWAAWRLYAAVGSNAPATPIARVRRGDVTFTVTGRGQLQGGSPEVIAAPMAGGEMRIKSLRTPGELVRPGDVVVEFDTAEQEYQLKEAESDLAEAEQQVAKATAEKEAQQEENRFSLLQARGDVRQAELEVRKNPLQSAISARQNELALQAARDRLAEIEHDLANRGASSEAAIATQEAARSKAQMQAAMARHNIELMTVRARGEGYVSVRQNTTGSWFVSGMALPLFRAGDRLYPGMAVADIPDLKNWELTVAIDELDRGHLAPGQTVDIRVVALPFRAFHGSFKHFGGTFESWGEHRFECVMTVDDPAPELRPGMTAEVVVTTDVLKNALWVPAQAIFESDGRTFVYVPSGSGFAPRDVKLVRRSETQAVITGLADNQAVALASPEQQTKKAAGRSGALKALPR
jgi:multidrug efflux pump subunit AcrA (membrane-fusion protein)